MQAGIGDLPRPPGLTGYKGYGWADMKTDGVTSELVVSVSYVLNLITVKANRGLVLENQHGYRTRDMAETALHQLVTRL